MSHAIDETTGKAAMAYTGEEPWHGLGQKLPENASISDWIEAAGMDWLAEKGEVDFTTKDGSRIVLPDRVVVYRNDTKAPLGFLSPDYNIIQPREILEFYEDLVKDHGFKVETAGVLFGGKKVWALANTGQELNLDDNDILKKYVLLCTEYTGNASTIGMNTCIRVVCNNTISLAINGNEPKIRIPHSKNTNLAKIKTELGLAEPWDEFTDKIHQLVETPVSPEMAQRFMMELLYPERNPDEIPEDKRGIQKVTMALDILENAPGQNMVTAKNTAYGLWNAITYMVDHNPRSRTQDAQVSSAWFGSGDTLKRLALDKALGLKKPVEV